jgi:hypothetical protein
VTKIVDYKVDFHALACARFVAFLMKTVIHSRCTSTPTDVPVLLTKVVESKPHQGVSVFDFALYKQKDKKNQSWSESKM